PYTTLFRSATEAAWQTPPGARPNRGGAWAWFRPVARVGCWSGGAIRRLEEWSHIAVRRGQNPAYRPSGISPGEAESRLRRPNEGLSGRHGKADAIDRLGIPALARIWRRARDREGAPVRSPWLRAAGRPARAQIAQQPRALVFLRDACRRI